MRSRQALCAAIAAALLQGCVDVPPAPVRHSTEEVQKLALGCEGRHAVALEAGATPPRPEPPLRVGPQTGGPPAAYACVIVTVSENGEALESKLLETDDPAFGQYLVNLARQSRYQPATRNGKPFAHKSVVSAAYW